MEAPIPATALAAARGEYDNGKFWYAWIDETGQWQATDPRMETWLRLHYSEMNPRLQFFGPLPAFLRYFESAVQDLNLTVVRSVKMGRMPENP